MVEINNMLSFSLKQTGSLFGYATVTIPSSYVDKLYAAASSAQQTEALTHGFGKGTTPISYIEQNFQFHLIEHIKEFLFKYFVINWLYNELQNKKICIASEPRLLDISLKPHHPAQYNFSLTLAEPITLNGWKRLIFKAPKRKNYKDLDKQVENFLKEEQDAFEKHNIKTICISDWIYFSISILDANHNPIFGEYKETLWLKIGSEEADFAYRNLFLGKKINDVFISSDKCLQEYFSDHIETNYPFKIHIIDHLPQSFFCIEHFKKHFKIKNHRELHLKLIEVFSYRNDLSQRRSIVEDALRLLISKHTFDAPEHLVLRQQKLILDSVCENPDYQVYKIQKDFHEHIRELANKQVKETILMTQLAYLENISITPDDIKNYLNLLKRPRTKEFIYFEPPITKVQGQEVPISSAVFSRCCLHEKSLNHIIHHLTKANKI